MGLSVRASFFVSPCKFIEGPLVFVGILSWLTATMFMDVYYMCLDTILMCYIADEEANDGDAKYVDRDFKLFIEEHGQIVPGTEGTLKENDGYPQATPVRSRPFGV